MDPHSRPISIPRLVLETAFAAARKSLPLEFGAILRGIKGDPSGRAVKEMLLLPGTVQGHGFTSFHLTMMPLSSEGIGTIHSHPSGIKRPSDADLLMFSRTGNSHIIIGNPFRDESDARGFDSQGKPVEIMLLD